MTTVAKPSIIDRVASLGRPLLLLLALGLLIAGTATMTALVKDSPSSVATAALAQLKSQVDTTAGAPVSGRDPSIQIQTSLAAAASTPGGLGQRVTKPAANVVGAPRHIDPATVLPDSKKTGVLVSGCLLAYGTPGTQCVPAQAPNNQPISCNFVRMIFPKGVKIGGTDSLKLSTGNGMACAATRSPDQP